MELSYRSGEHTFTNLVAVIHLSSLDSRYDLDELASRLQGFFRLRIKQALLYLRSARS